MLANTKVIARNINIRSIDAVASKKKKKKKTKSRSYSVQRKEDFVCVGGSGGGDRG